MAAVNNDKLDKLLVQVRRIEAHREADAEKAIRREYKKLYKELKEFITVQYAELAKDGKLTFDMLAEKQMQARFLEEVQAKVDGIMPEIHKEVTGLVESSYNLSYKGMIDAVNSATSPELREILNAAGVNSSVIRSGVNNTLVNKIILNDVLEKNRKQVVYNIKRDVTIGLSNGDRLDTMAKRISKTLDGDYKKAVRVVRTEAHRTVEEGFFDAAKEVDAAFRDDDSKYRMVKIWITMRDERVRPQRRKGKRGTGKISTVMGSGANHVIMDNKTVLMDEPFELSDGATTQAPGLSGVAAHDINCRCIMKEKLWTDEEYFAATGKHFPNYKAAAPPKPQSKDDEFKPLINVSNDPLDIRVQQEWEAIKSKDITPHEIDAIYGHMRKGYDGYIGTTNSWRMNNRMRDNPTASLSDLFSGKDLETAECLHNVIQRNTIPHNTVVVRKAGNNFARETLHMNANCLRNTIEYFDDDTVQEALAEYIGTKVTEHGFVATSANMELNVFTYKPITLEFQTPKGTKAFITDNYAESEVIFDRGFTYEITGFELEGDNSLKIIAKVVDYDD